MSSLIQSDHDNTRAQTGVVSENVMTQERQHTDAGPAADAEEPDHFYSLESDEIALAVELWRTRGCPEGGLPEDLQRAREIWRASAWSR